jgi:aryl-phospho-beta-D-glucosidase BglC (GH1 family)
MAILFGSRLLAVQPAAPDPSIIKPDKTTWPPVVRGFQLADVRPESTSSFASSFAVIRDWGANVARLQLTPRAYALRAKKPFWDAWPRYLDSVENVVKEAQHTGVKLIPVLMDGPDYDQSEGSKMWSSPDLQRDYARVWTDLASRLAPYKTTIYAYDLLNEPLDRTQLPLPPKQWRPLALELLKGIRAVDPSVWVVYETGPGSQFSGFQGLIPLPDSHVIYSAHFYYPQAFTHQGITEIKGTDLTEAMKSLNVHYPGFVRFTYFDKQALAKVLEPADAFQAKWHVPIYVGEFSVIRWAPKADAVQWLRDVIDLFEARQWSWTYHAFREYTGWSLEHDETFSLEGSSNLAVRETERAKVVRGALKAFSAQR